MTKVQHQAGRWVDNSVRENTTARYEDARQLLLEALQSPDISPKEREQLTAELDALRSSFAELESEVAVEGKRRKKTKVSHANRVFREFDALVESVADNTLIAFRHLLGESESGVRTGIVGKGDGSRTANVEGEDGGLLPQDEALALFRSSPEEFSSYFRALSAEDRQLATMSLQEEMQAQNQIFSLLSNLQQSEHQTSRAVIGNIRV